MINIGTDCVCVCVCVCITNKRAMNPFQVLLPLMCVYAFVRSIRIKHMILLQQIRVHLRRFVLIRCHDTHACNCVKSVSV